MLGLGQRPPTTDTEALSKIEQDNTLHEVEVKRGLLGRVPSALSIVVITVGVYLFAKDIGLTVQNSVIASLLFFAGAVKVEDARTNYFAEVLSYFLKKKIGISPKFPMFGLLFFIAVTGVFTTLDIWSGVQGGNSLYNRYVENGVKSSIEYRSAQAEAKSGAKNAELYLQLMQQYRADKREAQATCTSKWRLPLYRTKNGQCMDKWNNANQAPKLDSIRTSTEVSAAQVSNISAKVQQGATFIMNYLGYIIMALSLLLTLFAIIGPINSFRAKLSRLDKPTIEKLKDRWEKSNLLKQERLSSSNTIQEAAHKARNKTDSEIEILGFQQSQKIYDNMKIRLESSNNAIPTAVIDVEAESTDKPKMLPKNTKAAFLYTGNWSPMPPKVEAKEQKKKHYDFDLGEYNASSSKD